MLYSMTAFANVQKNCPSGVLTCELRTVNSRYLEIKVVLPENFRILEEEIRRNLSQKISRGRLECTISFKRESTYPSLNLNYNCVSQIVSAAKEITELTKTSEKINPMDLLSWPGVLTKDSFDLKEVKNIALGLLQEAMKELVDSRQREGRFLSNLILNHTNSIKASVSLLREKSPEIQSILIKKMRSRIIKFIEDPLFTLDPIRLEQEIVILINKNDITEECDRLDAHIIETQRVLKEGGVVGRRLDFLMQELNREVNTIASKISDHCSRQMTIDIKVLIEQIREQVQNIE